MTAPGANPGPGVFPSAPLNPDGTPNLTSAAPASGRTTIWDIPNGIDPSKPIWFDIGHRQEKEHPDTSSLAGIDKASKGQLKSVNSSYEILSSPEKIMKQFAAMSYNDPQQFFALQAALASGPFGHITPSGSFDSATETALGHAMLQYVKLSTGAGVGVSFTDFLLQTAQRAQSLSPTQGGTQSTQSPIVTTDPESIRQAAQAAAQGALGQGLSDDQLSKFVAQFQAAQVGAQTATSGTVNSPDLGSDAMAFVQQSNPDAYKQNQRTAYLDQLVNLLGGSRPNQQPVASAGAP